MDVIFTDDPKTTRNTFLSWLERLHRFEKQPEDIYHVAVTLFLANNRFRKITKDVWVFKCNDMTKFDDAACLSKYEVYDSIPSGKDLNTMDEVNEYASWLTLKGSFSHYENEKYTNHGNFQLMMHFLIYTALVFTSFSTNHTIKLDFLNKVLKKVVNTISSFLSTDMKFHIRKIIEGYVYLRENYKSVSFKQWFDLIQCHGDLKNRRFSIGNNSDAKIVSNDPCKFCKEIKEFVCDFNRTT